jgi:Tfp pilus assembly PilM family ATPase
VIEAGGKVTVLALCNQGRLALIRKFDFGGEYLVAKVMQQMGVDHDIARGVISDGSFDISAASREVMGPFLRQLSISRDFVERKENCRILRIYLSGGLSRSSHWVEGVQKATGTEVEIWNPFDGLNLLNDAYPAELRDEEPRFAAAVGAGLGVFGEP